MKQRMLWWLAAGLAFSVPVMADGGIGYVDVRVVMNESKTGQQFKSELEKFVKDKQASFKKEDEKLNALRQKMEKESVQMSEAQKQEKQKDFEAKVQAFSKSRQDADRELQKRRSEFEGRAMSAIRQAASELAKSGKLNMVLIIGREGVLYADEGMDLTDKVTEMVDAKGGKKK